MAIVEYEYGRVYPEHGERVYWVAMIDRDGGEKDLSGPYDCIEDAKSAAEFYLDCWQWVTYEIQEGDD
jgi:hypothetical protein